MSESQSRTWKGTTIQNYNKRKEWDSNNTRKKVADYWLQFVSPFVRDIVSFLLIYSLTFSMRFAPENSKWVKERNEFRLEGWIYSSSALSIHIFIFRKIRLKWIRIIAKRQNKWKETRNENIWNDVSLHY